MEHVNTYPLKLATVLFEGFELLDVGGPLEMFGILEDKFDLYLLGQQMLPIKSCQGPKLMPDMTFNECEHIDVLLIPGGRGTRKEINNKTLIEVIRRLSSQAKYVLTVCTGAALLAKTALLDNRRATTNKLSFAWVKAQRSAVKWIPEARWVEDGKFFTSSGVSAGMDMSLAFIANLLGKETSQALAHYAEYQWHQDPSIDPFAKLLID
jgi:putative intracellular protease/amidase